MLPEQGPESGLTLHATEDALELYSMERLGEAEVGAIEEHLLLCPICRRNLERIDANLSSLRSGLKALEERIAELQSKRDGGKMIMFRLPN